MHGRYAVVIALQMLDIGVDLSCEFCWPTALSSQAQV